MDGPLGIAVPIAYPLTVPECVELGRRAEAVGYESLWIPEVIGTEAFSVMAALAGVTSRLRLGTGIVPIFTRTPALLAMSAASLAQLARVREYIGIIRKALAGERVTQEDGLYPLRNLRLALALPQERIPIYLAALNPRMLQLAGELADGVFLTWISEGQIPWVLEHLQTGAARAGRSLDDFVLACHIRVWVTDVPDSAKRWLQRELTGYATVDAYQRYFRHIGFGSEAGVNLPIVFPFTPHADDRASIYRTLAGVAPNP